MANFKDLIKSALDKKQGANHGKNKIDKSEKGQSGRQQVVDHKPARKSAGRGR